MEFETEPQSEAAAPVEEPAAEAAAPAEEPPSEPAPDTATGSGRRKARRQRVDEYEAAALAKADPLEANLSVVTADMMGIACDMADAIKQFLAEGSVTLDNVQQIEPAVNSYLRVTRQMDRLLQLEVRAVEARKHADDLQSKLQMLVLQGHVRDAIPKGARATHTEW